MKQSVSHFRSRRREGASVCSREFNAVNRIGDLLFRLLPAVVLLGAEIGISAAEAGKLALQSPSGARFAFTGPVGDRISRNTDEWLLRAPTANPGMLEMFRVRDRLPAPQLVPWAGEFVGKYLISAIQALRMSDDPRLRSEVERVIRELIATQAGDGYLGPFPENQRLNGNWDLWGHYHVIEALLLWHEETGDRPALTSAKRAGDLICKKFLDGRMRVFDAGSHEMNMAVIHALGHLHRITGEPRYLQLMREIEKDWERAGDYLRASLDGREYYASPSPRWESLHDLQGLVELYRITGDKKYREAFEHHWRSIARNDIHNDGAFSSGEQATGNPYAPGAIETCCTVAWIALSVDMLRLTGNPQIADYLELALYNGGLGAQHPSGRWWTYNTPMDGVREASAHTIVFQSRAGTPELNCCSVNGPRTLGMLSDWAVMLDGDALVVNYFGPASYNLTLNSGKKVSFQITGNYPLTADAKLIWETAPAEPLRIKLRAPGWSKTTQATFKNIALAADGQFFETTRAWRPGDTISLQFDMNLRAVAGARETQGKVSIYRGPLLLSYDQGLNNFDEQAIPALDLSQLADAKTQITYRTNAPLSHWLEVALPNLRLCDFATAGDRGLRYCSWLPTASALPPPVVTRIPADGSAIGKAGSWFRWSGPNKTNENVTAYRLEIVSENEPTLPLVRVESLAENRIRLGEPVFDLLHAGEIYLWRVTAIRGTNETRSVEPAARFRFEPTAPFIERPGMIQTDSGPGGLLISDALAGNASPQFGNLEHAGGQPAPDHHQKPGAAVELNGSEMLAYAVEAYPEEEYSAALWVNVLEFPKNRLGQIFSAWNGPMDDPLRLVIDGGKLFARIENPGQSSSTDGIPLTANQWHHVAAVKSGNRLQFYLDGKLRGETSAPANLVTSSQKIALGGNPRYSGNEFLHAQFANFQFFARALSANDIQSLFK